MIIIRAYHERKNKDLCLIYNLSHGQTRVYSIPLDSVTYKVEIRTKMALLILLPRPTNSEGISLFFGTQYINNTTGKKLIFVRNKKGKTPDEVFTEEHDELVKEGGKWLSNTSNACSVVAGLFVTVTFTTSSTVPDSVKQVDKDNKAYKILAGSSFVSFCASLVAVVMFLAILTSGYRKKDFRYSLLKKLLLGLTAFYVSIASTLISFCSGHFSIFKDVLKSAASSSYLVVCLLLITFFAFQQLPLYVHLLWATFKKVPQRNYRFSFPR
jgi:hypothetical protein